MPGQHLEYVLTFDKKCASLVGMETYGIPFMDHIARRKDGFMLKNCEEGKLRPSGDERVTWRTRQIMIARS